MPAKPFFRTDRLSAQIRRDLGVLVHNAVRTHRLPLVSVSEVEVARDVSYANVYFTALDPSLAMIALDRLNGLSGVLRSQLARKMVLRHVPALHFKYDDAFDKGQRIDALLDQHVPKSDGHCKEGE